MILTVCRCRRCGKDISSTASCQTARFLSSKTPSLGRMLMMTTGKFGSATSTTRECGSSSCITHSMLGMTAYRIWSPSHATQTKRRPCSITWKFFAHWLRFYNRFKKELGGDPILFPAEPNQFSAVVDKVMVGTTADMRRLADEAMKVVYIPSESRRSHALLPKNHVQAQLSINLRLTTLDFYDYHKKSLGVCYSLRVGTGCCVCMQLRKHLTNVKYNIEHLYVL